MALRRGWEAGDGGKGTRAVIIYGSVSGPKRSTPYFSYNPVGWGLQSPFCSGQARLSKVTSLDPSLPLVRAQVGPQVQVSNSRVHDLCPHQVSREPILGMGIRLKTGVGGQSDLKQRRGETGSIPRSRAQSSVHQRCQGYGQSVQSFYAT